MAIILDSDVLIEGEKGNFDVASWLASCPDEPVEIAAITVAELLHGLERAAGGYGAMRERYLRTVLETFPILPYTERTAYEHARIWAQAERSGKMIRFYDLIVAATALERGSQVATFNTRHFRQIPGLRVIEPA